MTPIWMFEGTRELDPVAERRLVERRFSALAAAVRDHEVGVRRHDSGRARPSDLALYRRLREILGEHEAVGDARA